MAGLGANIAEHQGIGSALVGRELIEEVLMLAPFAEATQEHLASVRIVWVVWLANYLEFCIAMQKTHNVLCWRVKVHAY
jgi:hypothetical protein